MSRKGVGIVRRVLDHYLREELNRVNDLETAVRILVDSPSYVHEPRAGFNGVAGRKKIFGDLLAAFDFRHILETGTYLGDTSGYMAVTSGLPVLTCELNPSLYRLAKMRLKNVPSVRLHNTDSRTFLTQLRSNAEITGNSCFLYLDAHWGKDNPLRDEISLVASAWDRFIMMIDDFQVPGDSGYLHEGYGTLEYIDLPRLKRLYGLRAYVPSMPSGEEPVPPTGCVVLARNDPYGGRLAEVGSLRPHDA